MKGLGGSAGASRRLARSMVCLDDVRRLARRRVPRMVYDFIDGGAEGERTLGLNRLAFERHVLNPKVLSGASAPSTGVRVAGQHLDIPVMLAPTGLSRLAGRSGETAAARAAERAGTVSVVSSASSVPVEKVAAAASTPQWFQLYPWGDWSLTMELLERARRARCTTLVVTVDVPVTGSRERDLRNGLTIPPRPTVRTALDVLRRPRWMLGLATGPRITMANLTGLSHRRNGSASSLARLNLDLLNPSYDWHDLARLRREWPGPLFVKGILDPDDARRAVETGADGVIVSNHGGRQADGVPASLDALPAIAGAVADRCEVLVDGGVRRGSDVLVALALGAKACLIGRPWMYGLAAAGEAGVDRVLHILTTEIRRTMTLIGCADVADLDRGRLRPARATLEDA
ncbi:alpha-hydroxy-acid oxidizing protein [Actinomadura graeca]|uniref:Alpha-hydroxy-acid oxidizing protein n=1 Tax=Actinomadura graeca TaxID=2750812 RepID=A0ABX8QXT5_9ACTN|nr:alpha-hydroxy acid oxidase [Actinomadura graeca]QXJ23433.1 alpha-hydroxy-acid oxidizing protein [Actinomadura graeca]